MSRVLLEVLIIIALIVLNGIFAMSEMAVVSARQVRLLERANRGSASARTALDLAQAPNNFLSTVQIGITLVGVLAGAFGGATIASLLSEQIAQIGPLAPYSNALGLGLVVLAITYATLVIGELVPKRIALQNPESVAAAVAPPMRALSILARPAVRVLSASTAGVVRLLGLAPSDAPPVTEEEIRILMAQGTEAGVFKSSEQDMIESVFRLDDRHINTLMTPHTEIVWLDVNDPEETIHGKLSACDYSTLPVCRGGLDDLIGMVRAKDLLAQCMSRAPLKLEQMVRQPRFVPETATASRLVELFRRSGEHSVLVIDEHGGIQGLITEHDLLEAIVGDIPSWEELDEPQAIHRDDGSWLLDGLMTIEEANDVIDLPPLQPDERGTYETIGGFMMSHLGAIPTSGAHFSLGGYRFEVVDMDGLRVDKVLVARDPATTAPPAASNLE